MTLRLHGDQLAAEGALDFAVNVWPGERPAALDAALHAALEAPAYPDERPAAAAAAARHGRPPDEALALNGACEGFWLLAHTLRPRLAACVHPSFTEPEAALRAAGTTVLRVPRGRPDFALDPDTVPEAADLVVLGNPNNPTGNLDPAAVVARLARPGRVLVVDESFMDFAGERESLAGRRDLPGLVVVRSLTKLWSLAGVRAGYLLAEPALVERLAGQRQPWSVNAPACAALVACASDAATPARVAAEVAAARAGLVLALAGVRVWPSAANFLLLRLADGPRTVAALRARGIAVRPAASFPGLTEHHVRVAVRRPAENRLLVEALRDA